MQFQFYLSAELGRLGESGHAHEFLSKINKEDLDKFGISSSKNGLVKQFRSQDNINHYIKNLSEKELISLTKLLSRSRENSVYDKLSEHSKWRLKTVPIEYIYLQKAEDKLIDIFIKHSFKLVNITDDSELWKNKPYCHYKKGEHIHFPICLAKKIDSKYIIFDGIHRSIQMILNGQKAINLYYYE